jgi:hypothetical protein
MRLNKWYLDFQAGDDVGFYYIMSLHAGGFKIGASGIYHLSKNNEIRSFRFSRVKTESLHSLVLSDSRLEMSLTSAQLRTTHGKTSIEGEWQRAAPPAKRLFKPFYRQGKHRCDWKVWMPLANVRLAVKDGNAVKQLTGKGYMDFVQISFPPWKIPFSKLYWGRLHSDDRWLVLALVKSGDGIISAYYEPGHEGRQLKVEVKKNPDGQIETFNCYAGPGEKRIICAEAVRTLEVQEVVSRAVLSRLPGRVRRLLGTSGVDRKYEVRALLDGHLYHGIMEEVAWNA